MIDGEQDVIVYEIKDYTISLTYASEKLQEGYHVTTLVFTKPLPKTLKLPIKNNWQPIPLLGVI
jgi:hypothetical protein